MILDTTTLYLYVETPLHAGVGSGLSSIDLPIQRERTTQYPMIQGSGIKGKLRSAAYGAMEAKQVNWTKDDIEVIFGPEDEGSKHAGALIVGDARILLFPVRSLSGVFAYVTSCDVLNRFLRDIKRTGRKDLEGEKDSNKIANSSGDVNKAEETSPWKILAETKIEANTALVTISSSVVLNPENTLVLEEFSFAAQEHNLADKIAKWIAENALPQTKEYNYWRNKVRSSLVILPDNDFRDFVVNATEIITRIRINREKKTVDKGALWTEEHLPSDTLLYVPIYATTSRKVKNGANGKSESAYPELSTASSILDKARSLEENRSSYIQLGGDETVGRGMVRMHWEKQEAK